MKWKRWVGKRITISTTSFLLEQGPPGLFLTTYCHPSEQNTPKCQSRQGSKPQPWLPLFLKHGDNYVPWSLRFSLHSPSSLHLSTPQMLLSLGRGCPSMIINGCIIERTINYKQHHVITNSSGGRTIKSWIPIQTDKTDKTNLRWRVFGLGLMFVCFLVP